MSGVSESKKDVPKSRESRLRSPLEKARDAGEDVVSGGGPDKRFGRSPWLRGPSFAPHAPLNLSLRAQTVDARCDDVAEVGIGQEIRDRRGIGSELGQAFIQYREVGAPLLVLIDVRATVQDAFINMSNTVLQRSALPFRKFP